jgi:virginiamycin B lyase
MFSIRRTAAGSNGSFRRQRPYSVLRRRAVWLTEWTGNAIVQFDPRTAKFESFPSSRANAAVRQMLGRPGEAWGAESGNDRLVVVSD